MDYQMLTQPQCQELVRRRVASLEADHYSNVLVLAETTDEDEAAAIMERQAEIERRIRVHTEGPAPALADGVPVETEAAQ